MISKISNQLFGQEGLKTSKSQKEPKFQKILSLKKSESLKSF